MIHLESVTGRLNKPRNTNIRHMVAPELSPNYGTDFLNQLATLKPEILTIVEKITQLPPSYNLATVLWSSEILYGQRQIPPDIRGKLAKMAQELAGTVAGSHDWWILAYTKSLLGSGGTFMPAEWQSIHKKNAGFSRRGRNLVWRNWFSYRLYSWSKCGQSAFFIR